MRSLIKLFPAALVLFAASASAQQYDKLDLSNQPLANEVCATCHGGAGQGNPIVGGPSLAGLEPWYLRTQLQNFRAGIRGSQKDYIPGNEMMASVARLSDEEIEDGKQTKQFEEKKRKTILGKSYHTPATPPTLPLALPHTHLLQSISRFRGGLSKTLKDSQTLK